MGFHFRLGNMEHIHEVGCCSLESVSTQRHKLKTTVVFLAQIWPDYMKAIKGGADFIYNTDMVGLNGGYMGHISNRNIKQNIQIQSFSWMLHHLKI